MLHIANAPLTCLITGSSYLSVTFIQFPPLVTTTLISFLFVFETLPFSYSWIISHCMRGLCSPYPCICQQALGCSHVLARVNHTALHTSTQRPCFHFFSVYNQQGNEGSYDNSMFTLSRNHTVCFPQHLSHFTTPPTAHNSSFSTFSPHLSFWGLFFIYLL